MKYHIRCSGCDDATSVVMELSPEEAKLITQLCESITKASDEKCMPTMSINEAEDDIRLP